MVVCFYFFFFFKQKTAYEMRISDWSSDVCSSDLESRNVVAKLAGSDAALGAEHVVYSAHLDHVGIGAPVDGDKIYNGALDNALGVAIMLEAARQLADAKQAPKRSQLFVAVTAEEKGLRSEEHTSELQSLMRISYAVFCLKKKKTL